MKWCRFQSGKTVSYGIIDGTTLTEVVDDFLERHEAFVISRTATVIHP